MRRTIPSTMALICFEAAARYQNFTQAAQDINLTQSAVSRQINLLEELLEQKLFERIRQRVKLTDAGQHYLLQIQPLLETLEIATIRMPEFQAMSGGINIGTYPTLGSRWLLKHLMNFSTEFPNINTNTITYLDNKQFDHNMIDIGIVQGDPPWPGCRHDYLMSEELAAVISPKLLDNQAISEKTLSSYRLLQHTTRPQSWDIWCQSSDVKKPNPRNTLYFSQFEMIIEATISGHGIAILPVILIERELADQRLTLAHPHIAKPESAYYLISPSAKANTKKVLAFRDWLLSQTRP
ncbi:transcriptional regulator [Kiloniella litopenaei]|uniref:Transcriptional regulator n=1 Tax=Kiloniella litopenaei TaxID=1549748 RepID=A0A0M2RAQ6_9PROT|nr:LysR substrate-binding domain-containing protein [Kiloniella litopenaei]KKJ76693.1 transcriptional regulator [Kiloniella litopenaei]